MHHASCFILICGKVTAERCINCNCNCGKVWGVGWGGAAGHCGSGVGGQDYMAIWLMALQQCNKCIAFSGFSVSGVDASVQSTTFNAKTRATYSPVREPMEVIRQGEQLQKQQKRLSARSGNYIPIHIAKQRHVDAVDAVDVVDAFSLRSVSYQ